MHMEFPNKTLPAIRLCVLFETIFFPMLPAIQTCSAQCNLPDVDFSEDARYATSGGFCHVWADYYNS